MAIRVSLRTSCFQPTSNQDLVRKRAIHKSQECYNRKSPITPVNKFTHLYCQGEAGMPRFARLSKHGRSIGRGPDGTQQCSCASHGGECMAPALCRTSASSSVELCAKPPSIRPPLSLSCGPGCQKYVFTESNGCRSQLI